MKDRLTLTIIFLCLILFLVVAWAWQNPPRSENAHKVTIGYLPIAASLPLFVAEEEGFWGDVDVELIEFKNSNDLAVAAAAKRIDIMATCAVNAALDVMSVSNTTFEAFLCNGYVRKTANRKSTDYLIGLPGESLESLKGKRIAFFPGSVSRVFANLVLPKYGLNEGDYEYIEMAPSEWFAALQSKRISAVNAVEPAASQILNSETDNILIDGFFAQVQQDIPLSAFWFIECISEENKHHIFCSIKKALDFIDNKKQNAVLHYEKYTSIPPEFFSTIGLNNWRLVDDPDAEASLIVLARILSQENAIRKFPEKDWIWDKESH